MSWKVRHEGSPQAVAGLSLQQVTQGLLDGQWEPTDEVMGPDDKTWVPIETHPQLEEVAADIEPPPPPEHPDETHIDMNALIDVCLVLLIFFIMTTTYATLQKMIDSPNLSGDQAGPIHVTEKQVKDLMIQVDVKQEDKGPVIRIADKVVDPGDLASALRAFVRGEHKTDLLINYDRDVPHGTIVAVEDAAKAAGVTDIHILVPKQELGK